MLNPAQSEFARTAWRANRGVQLMLLSLIATAAFVGRTSLGPLQETMRAALALSDNQMALLQGPPLAIGVLGAIPLGLLLDRWSRARMILILASIGVLANGLSVAAHGFALLFVARCLAGLSTATIWTAILSLLADWYPPTQRGRATMVVSVGAVVGMSGAFALGGYLISEDGHGVNAWRFAMLGLGAPVLAGLTLAPALVEPARVDAGVQLTPRQVYAALWRYRVQLWPLMVGFALVGGIADGAAVIWAAPTLAREFALTSDRVGAIMGAVLLITGVLAPILGGLLADQAHRRGGPYRTVTMLSGLLFVSVPTGLFPLAPGAAAASAGLALFLLTGTAYQVAQLTLITIVIPGELRASCMAWTMAMGALFAFGAAPLLVSQLSVVLGGADRIGLSLAMICFSASLIGAWLFWHARGAFR